jgi:hypothetical protein
MVYYSGRQFSGLVAEISVTVHGALFISFHTSLVSDYSLI